MDRQWPRTASQYTARNQPAVILANFAAVAYPNVISTSVPGQQRSLQNDNPLPQSRRFNLTLAIQDWPRGEP
jgi:hypothetical protein